MSLNPPAGFERMSTRGVTVWVRPEARVWAADALARRETLYSAAADAASTPSREEDAIHGRAPVYLVRPPSLAGRWAVRHYMRGGRVAPLLGDRYVRAGRALPLQEAVASEALRERGIPTPRVMAAAVYFSGPFFRGDLVTEYVDGAVDLGALLFERVAEAGLRAAALREAGRLVRRIASVGARHADLNVKNLLVELETSPPRLHVVDLDRCRVAVGNSQRALWGMAARLRRSIEKWERRTGRNLDSTEREALQEGFGSR